MLQMNEKVANSVTLVSHKIVHNRRSPTQEMVSKRSMFGKEPCANSETMPAGGKETESHGPFKKSMVFRLRWLLITLLWITTVPVLAANVDLIINKGHDSPIKSLAWSVDGKILAVSTSGAGFAPSVKLWDIATACEINTWHTRDEVRSLAFSPDGWLVAAAISGPQANEIRVWAVPAGREVRHIPVDSSLSCIAFSPDSKLLATGGGGTSPVRLWDMSTASEARPLVEEHEKTLASDEALSVVFSPDGKYLAGTGQARTTIWNVADGKVVRSIQGKAVRGVRNVAFSTDGKQLFKTLYDETIVVDVETGSEVTRYKHKALDASATFSPDNIVAAGLVDGKILLWEAKSGKVIQALKGYSDAIPTESASRREEGLSRSIAFDKMGKKIATAYGSTIRIWEPAAGESMPSKTLGTSQHVSSLVFSPNGEILANGGLDGTIELRDVANKYKPRKLDAHDDFIYSLAFSPDCKKLASASFDGSIKLWDTGTGANIQTIAAKARLLKYSPDGNQIAGLRDDSEVTLWNSESGELIASIKADGMIVKTIDFSPDSTNLVLAGSATKFRPVKDESNKPAREEFDANDGMIQLWQLSDRTKIRTIRTRREAVRSVCYAPDASSFYCLGSDGSLLCFDTLNWLDHPILATEAESIARANKSLLIQDGPELAVWDHKKIRLYDAASGKEDRVLVYKTAVSDALRSEQGAESNLLTQFSADGRSLATSWNDTVKIYDIDKSRETQTLSCHSTPILSLSLSATGRALAFADKTGRLNLWDLANGTAIPPVGGSMEEIACVLLADNGALVAVGCADGSIKIRNFSSGRELITLTGHSGAICALSFSPDSKTLMSAGYDNIVRTWEIATGKELQAKPAVSDKHLFAFSHDTNRLAIVDKVDRIVVRDRASDKQLCTIPLRDEYIKSIVFSPNGELLASCTSNSEKGDAETPAEITYCVKTWNATSGEETHNFSFPSEPTALAIDANCQTLFAGLKNGLIEKRDLSSDKVTQLRGHNAAVNSIAVSPDGKFIISGSADATVKFWSTDSKELATLVPLNSSDWAVVTRDGAFDASSRGAELMHFRLGKDIVDLAQLEHGYYEPGLVAKLLGFNGEPISRRSLGLADASPCPEVTCEPPGKDDAILIMKVKDRGGGIGRVEVKLNGRLLDSELVPRGSNPNAPEELIVVDLSRQPRIEGGQNVISIRAFEKNNLLVSRTCSVNWTPTGGRDEKAPELYAIVLGITPPAQDLNHNTAANDAQDIGKSIMLGGSRLFGADKVHLTVLCGQEKNVAGETRKAIESFFASARNSKPNDILVVYLAARSVIPEQPKDRVCYLIDDIPAGDDSEPGLPESSTITVDELALWSRNVPALKQVIVLDTAEGSADVPGMARSASARTTRIRAINTLADISGARILMRTAANTPNAESRRYGQGLFTYAFLKGMRGDKPGEEQDVDVEKLFDFVEEEVSRLAHSSGETHRPLNTAARPGFQIGRLTSEDKAAIPAGRCPVVLKELRLASSHNDPLNLSDSLKKRLDTNAASPDAPFQGMIQLDGTGNADTAKAAITAVGGYTISGDLVTVSITLALGTQKLQLPELTGSRLQIDRLTDEIIAAINRGSGQITEQEASVPPVHIEHTAESNR